jgi:hypothetical protein
MERLHEKDIELGGIKKVEKTLSSHYEDGR